MLWFFTIPDSKKMAHQDKVCQNFNFYRLKLRSSRDLSSKGPGVNHAQHLESFICILSALFRTVISSNIYQDWLITILVLIAGIQLSAWDQTCTYSLQGAVRAFHVADPTFTTGQPQKYNLIWKLMFSPTGARSVFPHQGGGRVMLESM